MVKEPLPKTGLGTVPPLLPYHPIDARSERFIFGESHSCVLPCIQERILWRKPLVCLQIQRFLQIETYWPLSPICFLFFSSFLLLHRPPALEMKHTLKENRPDHLSFKGWVPSIWQTWSPHCASFPSPLPACTPLLLSTCPSLLPWLLQGTSLQTALNGRMHSREMSLLGRKGQKLWSPLPRGRYK